MSWPNKISVPYPTGNRKEYMADIYRIQDMQKWCEDNLSSKGVLWNSDIERSRNGDIWAFYFAQPHDAVLFRLVNGV